MIARSMIAGAALFALAVGSTTLAEAPEGKGPLRLTERRYSDEAGNKLMVRFDDTGKVAKVEATDKQGKPLDVVQIPSKDISVCLPTAGASSAAGAKAAKPLCQPLAFVTDGAFVKMGTATCTCQVFSGYLYCYGDTCH